MKTANEVKILFADLPRDYRGLCMVYLPRPIRSVREYRAAEQITDAMAGFEERMNMEQKDYFDVVTDFMAEFDDANGGSDPEVSGIEMLRHLVQEHGMSAAEVSRILGADRTLGVKILRGDRRITADHARKLGARFNLDPGAFIR